MSNIIYHYPGGDPQGWHNDQSPAINETNLNYIEQELQELIKEVNDYVVVNETGLSLLKTVGEDGLLTAKEKALLSNIDDLPTVDSTHLVRSGGIYSFTTEKLKKIEDIADKAKAAADAIMAAFPTGEIKPLHKIATSGNYNDLENKLAGDGTTITINSNNVISCIGGGGGGGSRIPVQPTRPDQEEGDIWFREM